MSKALTQFLSNVTADGKTFKLNPSQAEFLLDWTRILALFGGVGNGKTTIACIKCIIIMENFPFSRGLIGRKFWPDLESTTMDEFFNVCPPDLIDEKGTRKSAGTPQCRFKNGSVVLFKHFHESGSSSLKKHRKTGGNFNFVYIDQAEELDREMIQTMKGRMRRIVKDYKGRICPQQIMLTGNPAGHNYVWQDFVKPFLTTGKPLPGHRMIEASTLENKSNLPPEFVAELLRAPDAWRRRYVDGGWDDYEGLIFDTISRTTHEVELPDGIPPTWEHYRVIDYGMSAPTTCMWWAVDRMGNCYLYDTYYEPGLIIRQHTENIMRESVDIGDGLNGYILTVYDPACMYKTLQDQERGFYSAYDEFLWQSIQIAEKFPDYRNVGLWGVAGNNDFQAGVGRVRDYGYIDPDHVHPITGVKGAPRIYFVKGKCEPFWMEHGDYTWAMPKGGVDFIGSGGTGKEVPDPSKPDHLMTSLRYFIMSRPMVNACPVSEPKGRILDRWKRHELEKKFGWKVA